MNIFIIIIIAITLIQVLVCHFSLWWVISLVARILFSLRIIGATFKVKTLCIVEAVSLSCMFLFNMIFCKDNFPWLRVLVFLVCCALSCLMMLLDDVFYVYVTEDDED